MNPFNVSLRELFMNSYFLPLNKNNIDTFSGGIHVVNASSVAVKNPMDSIIFPLLLTCSDGRQPRIANHNPALDQNHPHPHYHIPACS